MSVMLMLNEIYEDNTILDCSSLAKLIQDKVITFLYLSETTKTK